MESGARSTPQAASAAACKVQREDRSERDTSRAKEPVTFAALPNCGTEDAADGHFRRWRSSTIRERDPALTGINIQQLSWHGLHTPLAPPIYSRIPAVHGLLASEL